MPRTHAQYSGCGLKVGIWQNKLWDNGKAFTCSVQKTRSVRWCIPRRIQRSTLHFVGQRHTKAPKRWPVLHRKTHVNVLPYLCPLDSPSVTRNSCFWLRFPKITERKLQFPSHSSPALASVDHEHTMPVRTHQLPMPLKVWWYIQPQTDYTFRLSALH